MNAIPSAILLLAVPGIPLALALPALRDRLPRPCHLALLPAVVLLALPSVTPVELPWWLLGSGLGADGTSRLLLAMAVVLWATAAALLRPPAGQAPDHLSRSFFLLTLAGNLGAILATDLVGFFAFATLMGYGFYGLLVSGGNRMARRAGRIYLVFLVLADLALFEALLIAAAATEAPGSGASGQSTILPSGGGLYVWMVFAGFALKAGLWPVHFWLPMAFRGARPPVALLLGGVPVAMGLLGMVRWMPLGEIAWPGAGWILVGLGGAAMLRAVMAGLPRRKRDSLPASAAIFATGMFTIAVGAGLADPAVWDRYGDLATLYIAAPGFALAVLILLLNRQQARRGAPDVRVSPEPDHPLWVERLAGAALRRGAQAGFDTLPRWRDAILARPGRLWQVDEWRSRLGRGDRALQGWFLAMILLLLLGTVLVLAAVLS